MRPFKAKFKCRDGNMRETAKRYVEIIDHLGARRQSRGFTDKKGKRAWSAKVVRASLRRAAR